MNDLLSATFIPKMGLNYKPSVYTRANLSRKTGGLFHLNARVKVTIRCKHCGEKFVLKGKRERGRIDTGFKQCLCDNQSEFDVEVED